MVEFEISFLLLFLGLIVIVIGLINTEKVKFLNTFKKLNIKKVYRIFGISMLALIIAFGISGCGIDSSDTLKSSLANSEEIIEKTVEEIQAKKKTEETTSEEKINETAQTTYSSGLIVNTNTVEYDGETYDIILVDGGELSGSRQSNVAVDIGYGDRVYWALTNEYGQLVYVFADVILLQDDETEDVTSSGRYYDDEADVQGTELSDYDQGHVIADSLGGVSNAYNITPQESILNRSGDQAYMERVIRDANGCTDFFAEITYPNTSTQIPSHYEYTYVLMGNTITDSFDNVNPEETKTETTTQITTASSSEESNELSAIDTNGNGKVTIAEAEAAGYIMPITSDEWLYQYMIDGDGDGMVGE